VIRNCLIWRGRDEASVNSELEGYAALYSQLHHFSSYLNGHDVMVRLEGRDKHGEKLEHSVRVGTVVYERTVARGKPS
jgi:hypothetical protein